MDHGYIRLYRKIRNCKELHEPGKVFSKYEAWLDLCMNHANGIARDGLGRGEFQCSIRYLSRAWRWSKSKTERFLFSLQNSSDPMIKRVGHLAGQLEGHFIICKYELYNPTRDSKWDTKRDKSNKGINKEEIKESSPQADPSLLFDIFDSENTKLPQVKARSKDRLAKCKTRINQAVSDGCLEQYLLDFREAVRKAQSTPFLSGDNARGWRASLDWLIENHTNVYKVLEGRYDGNAKTQQLFEVL